MNSRYWPILRFKIKILNINILADFKILPFQNPEFKILAHFKILALQNPEFKILADFNLLALQNAELKILADYKVLAQLKILTFKGPEF